MTKTLVRLLVVWLALSGPASAAGTGALHTGIARGLAEGVINLRRADAGLPPLVVDQTGAIGSLMGKVDANGSLSVVSAAAGAAGDTRAIASLLGKVDANNNLFVTLAGGTGTLTTLLIGDGTAAAPSIARSASTNTGFHFTNNTVQIALSGTDEVSLGFADGHDFKLASGGSYNWSSTASATGGADLSLFRDAANTLAQRNVANAQTFRVYGTTTGPKYVALSHDGTNGVLDTSAGAGLLLIAPTNATSVSIGKAVTALNGVTTSGTLGVEAVVATGRATAQTGANASVSTVTNGASDASFEVSANILVTVATTHAFTVTCAYTDEGSTARTITLSFSNIGGTILTSIANAGGAVPYEGIPLHIRVKASTAITIATTGTFTTVTYNVEGIIRKLS